MSIGAFFRSAACPVAGLHGRNHQGTMMIRLLLLTLLAASSSAGAVVIRHDVDDAKYRIRAAEFPALVDMPGEGHGVLITPQWLVTAAPRAAAALRA